MKWLFILWQVSLVKSAIAKDSERDFASAINLYCESLEYFIPVIKCQWMTSIAKVII